jgi:hypothetical protein
MTVPLARRLMNSFQPATVIELVVVMSIHNALQRWTAAYPTAQYEPPVAAWVQKSGDGLGLAGAPASAEQTTWLQQLAALRKA